MKKLLIVDLQKGFINENCSFLVDKVSNLIAGGFDKVIATKFVNGRNSQFKKFLDYDRFLKKEETDLAIALPRKAKIVEKTSFALPEKTFKKLFRASDEIYVCGCDYDSCVLAICFQLFDHGFQPYILLDAVGSHSQKSVKKTDFVKICQKNFGKCSLIETNTL